MCLLTSPLTNLNRSPKPETNLSLLSPLRSPSVENWGENQSTNYRFAFVNWKDVIYKFTRRRGIFFWLVINLVEMVKSLDRNRSLVCCRGSEVSWRFILLFDFSKPLALNLLHIPRTTRQQSIRQQFFFFKEVFWYLQIPIDVIIHRLYILLRCGQSTDNAGIALTPTQKSSKGSALKIACTWQLYSVLSSDTNKAHTHASSAQWRNENCKSKSQFIEKYL